MPKVSVNHNFTKSPQLLTAEIYLKQYHIDLSSKNVKLPNVMLDTGSTCSIANIKTIQNLGFHIEQCDNTVELGNAVGQTLAIINNQCKCNIILGTTEIMNCEILLVNDNTELPYNMILGLDVLNCILSKIFTNNEIVNSISISTYQPSQKLVHSIISTDLAHSDWISLEKFFHTNCNFECDTTCVFKICNHRKYPSEKSFHLINTENITIDPNGISIVMVTVPKNISFDFRNSQLQINWMLSSYLQLDAIAHNQYNGETVPVRIINRIKHSAVHIPSKIQLICGLKSETETVFVEMNHVVELTRLPKIEQNFHNTEFEEWLEKRKEIVKKSEFNTKIEKTVEKSDYFKNELKTILMENNWVFSRNSADIGLCIEYICELEWKNTYDGAPLNKKPYSMDPELSDKVDIILNDMINNDIIEICNSSYNTALLAVRKPNGQIRLVQDYSRTINPHINLPNFPIANSRKTLSEISEHISHVKNVHKEDVLITSLDLKSGFHIIPMRQSHRKFLAFKHKNRQYTFKRMSMGPKNSPSDFCAIMSNILNGLDTEKTKILIYIDDVLILSAQSEALEGANKVLSKLSQANMFINLEKCSFFNKEVKFLGYLINQNGFRAIDNKLQSIVDYPMPKTLKEAWSFSGICTYYTRYIPKLQILLAPLYDAIKLKSKFKLSEEGQKGIKALQNNAKNGFNLEHLDWNKPVFVCADCSLIGIGTCLGNCEISGNEISNIHVCAYASRSLDLAESLLSSRARECIGAAWALEAFSDLLHKTQKIYLITDHLSMSSIFTGNPLTAKTSIFTRFRRAIAVLLEYNIDYIYLPNTHELVRVCDGLSRNANFEKRPLQIRESELGLHIEIIHDLSKNQVNQISEIQNSNLPVIPQNPLLSKEDLINGQKNDSEIQKIYQKLKSLKEGEYYFEKGKQYLLIHDLVCLINSKNLSEILIPEHMSYHVVQYLHHSKDHASMERLIFFINQLNINVKSKYRIANTVVSQCYLCQLSKPCIVAKDRIKSYSLRPSLEPFTSIRADLMDFTHAGEDFKYVLTLLDTFSLYLEIYFLPDKKSVTVAREIALYASKFGLSGRAEITTDLGTEFENKNLEYELKCLNITKLTISGMNPCSNRIERCHLEIKRLLRNQLHKRNWDMKFKIQIAVNKYNNLESKGLDYKTPFNIIFGWQPDFLSSIFTILENKDEKDRFNPNSENISPEIEKWLHYHNNYIMDIARERFEFRAMDYDEIEPFRDIINVNDIVACKFPQRLGECAKLKFEWRAPFIVTSKNMNSVRIECVHTRAVYTRNMRLLKKLKLDKSFEEMLRKRDFVIKENYFFPVNTTINDEITLDKTEINAPTETEKSSSTRTLRSGRIVQI